MTIGLDNEVPQEAIDRCLEIDESHEMRMIVPVSGQARKARFAGTM
ncbi:MAG: hypothetical protein JXA57_19685 [Armatimonadetes bacterium]|nr:hypothetical protein [Armatimonadota bacterium]